MGQDFDDSIHDHRENLLGLIEAVGALGKANGSIPSADSPAMAELVQEKGLVGEWGGDPVSRAHTWASLLIAGSASQFGTLARIVVGDPSLFGPQSLTRSGLEMAARAHWLLDPDIDVRRRVARHKTEELHSLYRAGELMGGTEYAVPRAKAITSTASELGFRLIRGKREPHTSIHERRPSATRAFESLLDPDGTSTLGRPIFAYLSAVDHGTVYALMHSIRTHDRVPVAGYPGIMQAPLGMDSQNTALLLSVSTLGLARAADRYANLNGWADHNWRSNFLNALRNAQRHMRHVGGDQLKDETGS